MAMNHPDSDALMWPHDCRGGVSLCFDDGEPSQLQWAVPALNQRRLRASFYLNTGRIEVMAAAERAHTLAQWAAIRPFGHEIGNHSRTHPGSANFAWVQQNLPRGLEDLSLADIAQELDESQRFLQQEMGLQPTTFAYPCGMSFVGRGTQRRSYVPLVAERFRVGRGFNSECTASPLRCDLACVPALSMDCRGFAELAALLDSALAAGQWLILVGHSIGDEAAPYSTQRPAFEALLDHLVALGDSVWVDTVEGIGSYLLGKREQG
jgi:peptidoglycan/xylan/chitin deacetylase (PgdA/CDA1 family)